VLLSIPAIYLYSFFRNRIATITIETTTLADDQLRSASTLMRRKPDAK
jgi:hypothetical protein